MSIIYNLNKRNSTLNNNKQDKPEIKESSEDFSKKISSLIQNKASLCSFFKIAVSKLILHSILFVLNACMDVDSLCIGMNGCAYVLIFLETLFAALYSCNILVTGKLEIPPSHFSLFFFYI